MKETKILKIRNFFLKINMHLANSVRQGMLAVRI